MMKDVYLHIAGVMGMMKKLPVKTPKQSKEIEVRN